MTERLQAERSRDLETFARFTADDFTRIDERGRVMTKAERIAELAATPPSSTPPTVIERALRVYEDCAVQRATLERDGGLFRYTTLWVKDGAGWRVASVQVTAVAP